MIYPHDSSSDNSVRLSVALVAFAVETSRMATSSSVLSEEMFFDVIFYVLSFPPGVYVGISNLITSILGPSTLTLEK